MKTSIKPASIKNISIDVLTAFSREWREPIWVLEERLKALANYKALPWPTNKDARWKRTGLENLDWDKLELHPTPFTTGSAMEIPPEAQQRGVQWLSLDQAINNQKERLKQAWSDAIDRAKQNKFLSLTLALGNGGGCLIVPKGQVVKAALTLPTEWNKGAGALFPLNFVFLEEASEAHVWEELMSPPEQTDLFISSYTLLTLKENAKASFYNLQHWDNQTWHFQFQEVMQSAFSKFNAVEAAVGGLVFHNETTMHLQGQGAENKLLGILFGEANQNFENWITQNHTAIKTVSDIQYRGALKGSAHSFFSGLVSITKDAQQSNAYQSSKTMLLSKDARADAIPNLEILADDVQCSHGAAVGPVDEEQKYYLQTRGIPPSEAEEIIIQGFLEPVIAEVPSPLVQEQLRNFIEEKINN